jgi:hypothetical protein
MGTMIRVFIELRMEVWFMKKTGKKLATHYRIPVQSAYYHGEGHWFWNLQRFPAAYFDDHGYVLFETEKDYVESVYLSISSKNTNVRGGATIANMPGYHKLEPPPALL